MELKHTTITTSVAAADSPDTDGETPLHPQQIQRSTSFLLGKNHHLQPPPTVVKYKECLKNHAATIGSHAVDGCCEFMPSPTCIPHESSSLKCAVCRCHRNFHRREPISDVYTYPPHMLLFSTPADQSQMVATPETPAAIKLENPHRRKRFRTKFNQNQKEQMHSFAEKVGWKMQRCDDKTVSEFCDEIGIKKGVFKVWMHNNKNTFGRKDKDQITSPATADVSTDVATAIVNVDRRDNSNSSYQENGGAVHLHASNNGSSSSC